MSERRISRRAFLKGAAGLQLGLFLSRATGDVIFARVLDTGDPADHPDRLADTVPLNLYLAIDTDGTVTITNPRPDMGQGPRTSLPMHTAEELEADWEKVRIVQAQADSRYGSQTSGGSTSTRNFWTPMRQAGAAARMMLVAAAAARWGVAADTCRCERGVVIHDASGRRLTYGELAEDAAGQTVPSNPPLKSPSEYTIVGQPMKRVDAPQLVDGGAVFGSDVRVPGMLRAVVARPHPFGGRAESYDDTGALAVPGVRQVLRSGSGVAVVADHTWAALAGRDALEITWDPGGNTDVDDTVIRSRLQNAVGSLPAMPPSAAKVVEADYDLPYLAHAPMEPMNCVADVRDDSCEVWAPTQAPGSVQSSVARALGMRNNQVTVNVTFVGGGFGRRLQTDYASEAARLSRDVGAPVQVVWTRDDDMRHDYYRPASHHAMRGALSGDGDIVGWAHRMAIARAGGDLLAMGYEAPAREPRVDQSRPPYDIPGASFDDTSVGLPLPTGAWRSVNNTQISFANESFFDELAAEAGKDPMALRLALVSNGRLRGTLELAAEKSGWGEPLPAGHGRGVACFVGYGSYITHVVELSVSPEGVVRVHRVVSAVDCGVAVNPLGVEAQVQGGTSDGIATALKAAITVTGGAVDQTSFADYEWLRIDEMPEVEVHIVASTSSPGGMGEVGFPSVSPAVANAIFAATGRRVRRLPIRREDLAGWAGAVTPTATTAPPTASPTEEPEPTSTPEPPDPERSIFVPRVQK